MVWVRAFAAMFIITLGWYIACFVMTSIASNALSTVTGQGFTLLTMLEFIVAWWGPIMDIIVIIMAVINSQELDPWGRLS